jgi:hypothetical protein
VVERYRGRLIFAKAYFDRSSRGWTTSLHVQFNDDYRTFRDVWLPAPIGRFMGKTSVEKHALEGAKQWVDVRLFKAKILDRRRGRCAKGFLAFKVAALRMARASSMIICDYPEATQYPHKTHGSLLVLQNVCREKNETDTERYNT